jgi:ABC-type Fe3+/spermidine/putrescine transport system ATPase subunit
MNLMIDGLELSYGNTSVLKGISIEAPSGKILGLLGPSGCGKTTLLRTIAGFEKPQKGTLKSGGTVLYSEKESIFLPPEKRNIGVVFQSYALWPHMTVRENISFPLKIRGASQSEQNSQVSRLLEVVKLEGLGDRRPGDLSGGQQQRVAIARALAQKPKLLLLDEPLSNLDPHLRGEMRLELKRLQRETGLTMILVTHDGADALDLCDEVAILDNGLIVAHGATKKLAENPPNDFVRKILTSS